MTEMTVEIQVPDAFSLLGFDRSEIQRRVLEWLALSSFTEGRISSGKAASLLNLSRVEFLDLLRARGVAYVNYSAEELADEFAAVKALGVKGEQ
jgi:predicted HTH domain antitoxin